MPVEQTTLIGQVSYGVLIGGGLVQWLFRVQLDWGAEWLERNTSLQTPLQEIGL